MNDITIVTAFYDIGRSEWDHYNRTNDHYFECFERLCKLKNKIIVFSEIKFKEKFENIKNNIKSDLVVVYEDVFSHNNEILNFIEKIQKSKNFIDGIYDISCPEYWNPKYVLINFLKSRFCINAIEKFPDLDETVAWIDFGYARKDECIPASKVWEYNFEDKIHMWNILDIPQRLDLTQTIKSNTVYIQGCHIVCTKEKWHSFSDLMDEQLNFLTSNNLIDDDQTLMLMSYLSDPYQFNIHKEFINRQDLDWFFIFQYYNDHSDLKYLNRKNYGN